MIGDNIRKFRKNADMTQDELAEKLNVTRQTLSSWETERTQPDIEMLVKIAETLGATPEELIYNKPTPDVPKSTTRVITRAGETGIGLGSVIAAIISYVKWHSIGWAIVHGTLGWAYIVYFIIKYGWNG